MHYCDGSRRARARLSKGPEKMRFRTIQMETSASLDLLINNSRKIIY